MNSIRALSAAFTIAFALSGLAGVADAQVRKTAPSPAPGTMWLYPERIRTQDGSYVVAERGYFFAPANRNDPKSEVIGVEVYRFRADRTANATTPPLFFLHGGPNFVGLEPALARPGYYERQIKPYLAVADYVVVGQRGIGSSKPTTTCERPRPLPVTATNDDQVKAVQDASIRCRDFWTEWGLDVSGLTVMQAAADVDDVRKALGYDRIQIWGGSFGSHWAMALMRFYPQAITRVVLRGLEGPDHTYDSPAGLANALERIGAAADTAAALRGRVPAGGLYKALQDVIARLDRNPVAVTVTDSATGPVTVRVDGDAVRNVAVIGPRGWPALVLALHAGDYTTAARAAIRARTARGIQTASYYVLDCGSGISRARDARYAADAKTSVAGEANWEYRAACPVWQSDNGDAFRADFQTNIPTLIVHGDWDLSTPLENALELRSSFKNRHFVLVKGGSHGSLTEAQAASPEFTRELLEFFASGDMTGLPTEVVLPAVRWNVPGATTGN